jgi:hypothetical protein
MNKTLFIDDNKNAIRPLKVTRIEAEIAFTGFGIKYVAYGVENYYTNNKKFNLGLTNLKNQILFPFLP